MALGMLSTRSDISHVMVRAKVAATFGMGGHVERLAGRTRVDAI
jgi:hypothetical protein